MSASRMWDCGVDSVMDVFAMVVLSKIRLTPRSKLFPFTTFFRSRHGRVLIGYIVCHFLLLPPPLGVRILLYLKITRLNSIHISYACFCLKKKLYELHSFQISIFCTHHRPPTSPRCLIVRPQPPHQHAPTHVVPLCLSLSHSLCTTVNHTHAITSYVSHTSLSHLSTIV